MVVPLDLHVKGSSWLLYPGVLKWEGFFPGWVWILWVGNVDFESVLMYFCLFCGDGWFTWFACQGTLRAPPCWWSQVRRILQGFWVGSGIGLNASDGQCGFWECFRCVVLALWGWQSSMVCMSMDPHGSVILVLSGERNSQGFWVDLGRLHWNCNIDLFRAVLTSGCLLGVLVWIQCRWDGVQRCGGGTEEADHTCGTCSSRVGWRWKHCGDRACSGWSLLLILNQIYHFPNFAFQQRMSAICVWKGGFISILEPWMDIFRSNWGFRFIRPQTT